MNWSKPETHGNLPQYGFKSQSATLVKDKIFIFGGLYGPNNLEITDEEESPLYIFEPDTMFWSKPTTTGTRPKNLRAHSAVLIDNHRILLYGGGNQSEYADSLYILDTETMHWNLISVKNEKTSHPGKRRSHTGVVIKGKYYIFGGGNGSKALQDTWVLQITKTNQGQESFEWKELKCSGDTPKARGYHTSTVYNGMIYVYGGSDGVNTYNDIYRLDPTNSTWKKLDIRNNIPISAHSSCQIGPLMFSFGGSPNRGIFSSDFKSCDFSKKEPLEFKNYVTSGNFPNSRAYHCCVLYDSRVFVFGGCDSTGTFSDVWICDLGIENWISFC